MTTDHLNALPNGTLIGDYVVDRVLGAGGFAITYLAHHRSLGSPYAVKEFLPQDLVQRDGRTSIQLVSESVREDFRYGMERFLDEARILAQVHHPNITEAHNFFEANGTAYLVMNYEAGETLEAMIARRQGLDSAELVGLLMPLLDGVEAVHAAGVLHRDIKPGNIIVRTIGEPVLVDFGAARHAMGRRSRALTAIATPGYAAPEQYSETAEQGPWTDVYGLAGTAYMAIANERPADALSRLMEDNLVPASVRGEGRFPATLLAAVDAGLAVGTDRRPRTIEEWRRQLRGETQAPTVYVDPAAHASAAHLPVAAGAARFPQPDGSPAGQAHAGHAKAPGGPPPTPASAAADSGATLRISDAPVSAVPTGDPHAERRGAAVTGAAVALSVAAAVAIAVGTPHLVGADNVRATLAAVMPGPSDRQVAAKPKSPDEPGTRTARKSDATESDAARATDAPKAKTETKQEAETTPEAEARRDRLDERETAQREALHRQVAAARQAHKAAQQQVQQLRAKLAAVSATLRDARARAGKAEEEARAARDAADAEAAARRHAESELAELRRRLRAAAANRQQRPRAPRRPEGAPPFPDP